MATALTTPTIIPASSPALSLVPPPSPPPLFEPESELCPPVPGDDVPEVVVGVGGIDLDVSDLFGGEVIGGDEGGEPPGRRSHVLITILEKKMPT